VDVLIQPFSNAAQWIEMVLSKAAGDPFVRGNVRWYSDEQLPSETCTHLKKA